MTCDSDWRISHRVPSAIPVMALAWLFAVGGCSGPATTGSNQETAKAPDRGTDQIGEFDPEAGRELVDDKVVVTNPVTAALEAYGPMKQQIARLGIEHAVNLFYAEEGRYPRDHEEFMTRIIRSNNLRLPSLPTGLSYQYDVDNHRLVVVRADTGQRVE